MYLSKYVSKKKLGKGAYGDVYLVEDEKGEKYALKLIALTKFEGEEEYMREYLEGEIECMKEMDSPHTIKLYDVQEDKDFIYLILEYCDLGDLVNYQAKINK
jgi:serine/threonine protein kinase